MGRFGGRLDPYLLITVVSWGLNFVALKEAYREIPPPAVALLRYLVMGGALVLLCLWRRESLRLPREDAWRFLLVGFLSMGVYMVLFLEGMSGSGATEGAILLQLSPIFTAILAGAIGQERFIGKTLVGALAAFLGAGLIVAGGTAAGGENSISYNFAVIGAAAVWACSVVLMRPLLMRHSPLRVLTLTMPGGLPVMVAFGISPMLAENWGAVHAYSWLMFLHIALISGVLAFLCFYEGVRRVGATGATLYQYFVPAVAMFFAAWIRHVPPTAIQVAGFVVVLGGVIFAMRVRDVGLRRP